MSVARLEPVGIVPVPDGATPPDEARAMQQVTKEIAFDPLSWTAERRERVRQLFDELAPEWHTRDSPERRAPVVDALARGGVPEGGTCLEVGSGTGSQTPVLLDHFDRVVSVDLSLEMLRRSPARSAVSLVRADASRLPLAGGAVDAVVCVNAYLFPEEYGRVLAPDGVVVFVSALGERTPIYLRAEDVVAALEPPLGPVTATAARAGCGCWTVARRQGARQAGS